MPLSLRRLAAGVAALVVLAAVAAVALAAVGTPSSAPTYQLSQVISPTGAQPNAGSYTHASVSADGRYVAFQSGATNLSSSGRGMLVLDRRTGLSRRIATAGGASSISHDGSVVVFQTATALIASDTNGLDDVYVWRRSDDSLTRVSVGSSGEPLTTSSSSPTVSGDGRYALFTTSASNVVAGDTNNVSDVFRRDLQTNVTVRVSVDASGAQVAAASFHPSLSADGRYVAFQTGGKLTASDTNANPDVYVRDVVVAATELASLGTAAAVGNSSSGSPSISDDGRYVAFESLATNLVAGDTNGQQDVFVRDRTAGTTDRVSVATGGAQATGGASRPSVGNTTTQPRSISGDGRYVTFGSLATGLVADDTNARADVFVRDRTTGVTRRISVSNTGNQGSASDTIGGLLPSISADGQTVVFTSSISSLAAGDTNAEDVFIAEADETVPAAASISPISGVVRTPTQVTFDAPAGGDVATTCQVDSAMPVECTSPWTTPSVSSGQKTVTVRTGNSAGNVAVATMTFTADNTAPTITFAAAPPAIASKINTSWTASEPATYQCRVVGVDATASPCTSPYVRDNLPSGTYALQVTATDELGNPRLSSQSWKIDAVPAPVTLDGPDGLTRERTATYTFSTEADATLECRIDSGEWSTCASPFTTPQLDDGEHTISVRSTDPAGNTQVESKTLTVDATAPAVTLDGPQGVSADNTPSYTFTAEPGAAFECRLDVGAWASCSSPLMLSALADGEHTFSVRATDQAGNTGAAASRTVTVDTQGPATNLDGPSGLTRDASPTYSFTAESGTSFECRLDAGAWESCSSAKTIGPLADGEHTFSVRATDQAGNLGAVASRTVTVDTQAPTLDVGTLSGEIDDATPTLTFDAEAGATFQCRVDAGSWETCSSPKTFGPLSDGEHTIAVRAADAAGNVSSAVLRTFTVDTQAPSTTKADGPQGEINDRTASFSFSSETGATFECRVDGDTWTACTSPLDVRDLADGEHTVEVRARDRAGNVESSPATWTFRVDTAGPQIVRGDGPSGTVTDRNPEITFSAPDAVRFECRVDSDPWQTCTSPWQVARSSDAQAQRQTRMRAAADELEPLAPGPHTAQVRAIDAAGNVSDLETWTFTIFAGPSSLTDISAQIGEELSLATQDPASMELVHSAPAQSATHVDVTSTSPTWTLSVADNDPVTPGRMDGQRVSLLEPLQFGVDAGTLSSVTGTPQVLDQGELVDSRQLLFSQSLDAGEDVFADEQYQLTAEISAVAP